MILQHLHNGKWWGINNNLNSKGLSSLLEVSTETKEAKKYIYLTLTKLNEKEPFYRVSKY